MFFNSNDLNTELKNHEMLCFKYKMISAKIRGKRILKGIDGLILSLSIVNKTTANWYIPENTAAVYCFAEQYTRN